MLVSVIVPTYNRATMITKTIQSLLNQTYKDIEIIVVDDGSTDDTEKVVRGIANQAAIPVRYFKKPNGGCSSARNAGIRVAEGDCIAFLDSDDQYTPDAIESLVNVMKAAGAVDFVYSPSIEISVDGNEMLGLPAAPGEPDRFAREHFRTALARSCCILYKRHIFERLIFEETARYNEDSDFLQKVAINYTAAYSDVPTAKVFQHGGNKSSNRKQIYRALLKSYENILRTYPAFAQSLGDLADQRLDEVRQSLAEVLITEKDYREANEVLSSMREKPPLHLRASVSLRIAAPLHLFRWYRFLSRVIGKRLKRIPGQRKTG